MALPANVERLILDLSSDIEAAVEPLLRAAGARVSLFRLLHQIGWDLRAVLATDPVALAGTTDEIRAALRDAVSLSATVTGVETLAAAVATAIERLTALATDRAPLLLPDVDPDHRELLISELIGDLGEHLLLRHLQRHAPTVLHLARLVGVVGTLRRPALYLVPDPPAPVEGQPGPTPVRLPIRRLGLHREALRQAFVLPLTAFLGNLPAQAYQSAVSLLGTAQATLLDLVAEVTGALRDGTRELSVTVDGAGIELHAPGLLPTDLPSVPWPELEVALRPATAFPRMRFGQDRWRLFLGEPATDVQELTLIDGLLHLVDRFPTGQPVADPGVSLTVTGTDPGPPSVALEVRLGVRLELALDHEVLAATSLAVSVGAAGNAAILRFAALGEVVLPIALPGLSGLAFIVDRPSAQVTVADRDTEARLDLALDAEGFAVQLPEPLFRRAIRDNPDSPWRLEGPPPRITFTLDPPQDEPILSVGIHLATPEPVELDRLQFLALSSGAGFSVTADPIFIGAADPEHGFVVLVDNFTFIPVEGDPLRQITVGRAEIGLPATLPGLPAAVVVTDAAIDGEGFTGRASVVFDEPVNPDDVGGYEKLFGVLPIDFRSIAVGFEHNVPTEFAIEAAVLVPWFEEWVELSIGLDDAFSLTFVIESSDPAGITLSKAELLALTFRSAGFRYDPELELMALSLSGGIQPLLWNADGLEWPRLDVTGLTLEQDLGSLSTDRPEPPVLRFTEAWLDLAELATLDLFGFHFELGRIGIGYLQDSDEMWVDLSGSLRLIEFIPVGLGVDGFRITWPRRIYEELGLGDTLALEDILDIASRIQVRFAGVELFFGVPQAVEFEGLIRFFKDAQKVGFAGDMALRVPATGLAVDAGLLVGINFADPPYPFLFVHFGILLPAGIPLAQSGLALKGAKGLFGLNVVPDRQLEQNPYYDWYKREPEGAHPTAKWRDQIWSIAFGAGITITTVDGKIMGVQGLLALILPGPVIFIEGKALVFDGVFPGDGPLKALAFFDGNTLTAQFNIEAALELVEGVVDVAAGIEAYFDFQAAHKWHLYLGQEQPEDRRVYADFLLLPVTGWLFGADAWLMLDMADEDTFRSRLGVHIGFEPPSFDLVVASATLRAVIDGEGLLTVNPFQFTGGLAFEAVLDVEAFDLVAVGIDASAELSVEGALPLVVDAHVYAHVDLPVPDLESVPVVGEWAASALDWFEEEVAELPEIPAYVEIEIHLHWELDAPPVLDPLVRDVTVQSHFGPGGGSILPATGAGPAAVLDSPLVPLDARPTIVFDQNVNQANHLQFAGYASGRVESFHSGGLQFRPTLRGIRLWKLPRHAYLPGQTPDAAWIPVADTGAGDPDLALWGAFRPATDGTEPGRAGRRILDLFSGDIFEFLAGTVPFAVPADSITADLGAVPPGAAFAGPDSPAWCREGGPAIECVGSREFRLSEEHRRELVVAERPGGFTRRVQIGGIDFTSDDLRFFTTGNPPVTTLHADSGHPRGEKLLVRFPELVSWARLTVAGKLPTVRVQRGRTGDVPVDAQVQPVEPSITVSAGTGFDFLLVSHPEMVAVVEVCWTTLAEAEAADVRRRECERNLDHATRAEDPPPVLATGHLYRLEIDTSVELDDATLALASLPTFAAAIDPYRSDGGLATTDVYFFQTAGPPGRLHPYVRWLSPPEGSAGHFPSDDVVVRFRRPYIHRLYPDADNAAGGPPGSPYALEAIVTDADGSTIDGWFLNWTTSGSASLLPEERRWYVEQAGVAPPPDDVLEIRRRLHIQAGTQLGVAEWRREHLGPQPTRRTRWKHDPGGRIRVDTPVPGTSVYATGGPDWTDYRVDVEIERTDATGQAGLALLYASPERHYQVWITGSSVELLRIHGDRRDVLASGSLAGHDRLTSLGVIASARQDGISVRLSVTVGPLILDAVDPVPIGVTGGIALLASGTPAAFSGIAIGPAGGALLPGRRYTVRLVGGEGGPSLLRQDFTRTDPGREWITSRGTWSRGERGLQPSGPAAVLRYRTPFDDGELTATIDARPGERMRLLLRTPDKRRAPGDDGSYELTLTRTTTACEVECSASRIRGMPAQVLGRGELPVSGAPRLPLRVRMIGNRLRVWVFETSVIDLRLTAVPATTFRPVTYPLQRCGGLEVRSGPAPAALREIHLRDAELLRCTFTTSAFESFAEMLDRCVVDREPAVTEALADGGLPLVISQREYADARIRFEAEEAKFAIKRSDRTSLENARQRMVDAALAHDTLFGERLVELGGFEGLPLTVPRVRPVVNGDGAMLGYLLRAPESLSPAFIGQPAATGPHGFVGHTSFSILAADGALQPTAWLSTTDGSSVLVHWTATETGLSTSVLAMSRRLVAGNGGIALAVRRRRDLRDDEIIDPAFDHIHDRPYVLSRGSRADVIVEIPLV